MIIKFNSKKNNKIQIIGGKWKKYKIPVVHKLSVRPTTSRIRETLFNWLNPVILNATCLDCFAGSGALGLESLSRGAKSVTFIDKNYTCITSLIQTINTLKEYNSQIIHNNCCHWLKKTNNIYNIVFIDPPFYNKIIIQKIILLLEQFNHLATQSWIYIETSKNQNIFDFYTPPNYWILYRKKVTKNILCHLYHRNL